MTNLSPLPPSRDPAANPYQSPHGDLPAAGPEPPPLDARQKIRVWIGSTATFLSLLVCLEVALLFVAAVLTSMTSIDLDVYLDVASVAMLVPAGFLAWTITRGFHRENVRARQERNRAEATHDGSPNLSRLTGVRGWKFQPGRRK